MCGEALTVDNGGGVGIKDARQHCGVSMVFEELVIRKAVQRARTVQVLVPLVRVMDVSRHVVGWEFVFRFEYEASMVQICGQILDSGGAAREVKS